MKINVNFKTNPEFDNQLQIANNKALERTAQAILDDIKARGVVPKDTGELERSGFIQTITEMTYTIMFDTPYARRWYFNVEDVTFQKTKNPNAQDHWMDYYLDGEGMRWVIETYSKFLKEESGGLIQ